MQDSSRHALFVTEGLQYPYLGRNYECEDSQQSNPEPGLSDRPLQCKDQGSLPISKQELDVARCVAYCRGNPRPQAGSTGEHLCSHGRYGDIMDMRMHV